MKLKFIKTQTQETDREKIVKLSLSGTLEGISYNMQIAGDSELITQLKKELGLDKYGNEIEADIYYKEE
jgi:hypothetical protein